MNVVRAKAVFTPEGTLPDAAVEVSAEGVISAVRGARQGDPPALDGLLIPGLVNAHLHLELSAAGGLVPGGAGLARWVMALLVQRANEPDGEQRAAEIAHAAMRLAEAGTVAVSDISNDGSTGQTLADEGISGVVQHELLTFDAARLPERLRAAAVPCREIRSASARVVVRPSPHALYSTAPALVKACVSRAIWPDGLAWRPPASIHLAEDREERRFLLEGAGAWSNILDRLKVDFKWWRPPGVSPVAFLDDLGVLGPDLLLVHGVHLDPRDRAQIARAGAPLCLCPRSNLHIGGELPDVSALLGTGIHLCLGTDSLASSPDLDVLGEIPILSDAFPKVEPSTWLKLATDGGARALGLARFGRIAPGYAPGLVLLEGLTHPNELASTCPPLRRVIARPAVP